MAKKKAAPTQLTITFKVNEREQALHKGILDTAEETGMLPSEFASICLAQGFQAAKEKAQNSIPLRNACAMIC